MTRLLSLLGLALAAACGGSVQASHYDQRCAADGDCTAIAAGDVCSGCQCPDAAINVSARPRYEADVKAMRVWCPPPLGVRCVADCVTPVPRCVEATCTLSP